MRLSVDVKIVERPADMSASTEDPDRGPDFEEADTAGVDPGVVPGRMLLASCRPALAISGWAIAAFAGVPDFADLGGAVFPPEDFTGAGRERLTRSWSLPDVIEILRLVVSTVPSALSA